MRHFIAPGCLYILFLLGSSITANAQTPRGIPGNYSSTTTSRSYVRTWTATAPESVPITFITRSLSDVKQSTQYLDGLGRPFQTIAKQGSLVTGGTAVDMIDMVEYNPFGLEQFKYMPTPSTAVDATKNDGNFKLNPFSQQATFYNQASATSPLYQQGETFFYGQTVYEPSPLNRPLETFAPGNSWSGTSGNTPESNRRSVKMKYWHNTDGDSVRVWNVTVGAVGSFSSYATSTRYPVGTLSKNVVVDEQNKQVIEFKDQSGNIILKKVQLTATSDDGTGSGHAGWLCTYYLYDDLNNLRCVIQPRGVELIASLSWALTDATILAEQCFRYEYDERNRMIVKKVPGAAEVYMVYDARDRLVMTQDGNSRATNVWQVTLYDSKNRPEMTGQLVNTWNGNTFAQHRTAAAGSTAYPFTKSNLPSATYWKEWTSTFYDNYAWISGASPLTSTYNTSYNTHLLSATGSFPYAQTNVQSTQVEGMVTGTKTKVFNTTQYLYSVMIYDQKGRVIQVQSHNHTSTTAVDITTTQYNWAGQPLVVVNKQEKGGTSPQTTVLVTLNTYDDLGRPTKIEKKLSNTLVNSNAMSSYVTICTMEYDALGRVKKKLIGSKKDPATGSYYNPRQPLQELVHDYNVRGWMLGVNRDYLTTAGQTSDGKLFGFELGYDKLTNKTGENFNAAQWNGNISGMVWKSDGDDTRRKYDFTYDAANRILRADFEQQNPDNNWNNSIVNFNMKMGDGVDASSAYDANGNIKRLQQWGLKLASSGQIDDLTYNYEDKSNKLLNVMDAFDDP
ncbi:MAG: hypothetical protein JNK79_16990, partial [Chitinophagaceae bacterium]|nr:hypothetical protein [Chitinophagaceae bacterium]